MYIYQEARQMVPHPVLTEVRQIAANQVLLVYDQRADFGSATRLSNYWIRSNKGAGGAASLGMDEALTAANAIRPEAAMITAADNTNMRFIITFRERPMTGVTHIVLPCFVGVEGMTGYGGANWGPFSRNVFIGM